MAELFSSDKQHLQNVTFAPEQTTKARRGIEVQLYSFFNQALDGCGFSTPRPGRNTPGKDSVPILFEVGWASELVWTGAVNVAHRDSMAGPSRTEREAILAELS